MRVLIVDDESLIRMDLRDIIESCGHEVVAKELMVLKPSSFAKNINLILF